MDLTVTQLSCHRGDRVLFTDINFSVSSGCALHLSGANGSGKTTLMRTLAGLTRADQGEIRLDGSPVTELGDEYRELLTYVGHLNGLQPELNIRENLQYQTALGLGATNAEIDHAIHRVSLSSRARLQIKMLSQGQKRRAALARLFLGNQKLWLLDEPITALDSESIDIITGVMTEHLQKGGILIYTSHQPLALDRDLVQTVGLGQ